MNSTEDHETTEIDAKDETATASEHNHAANGSVEASPGGDTNEWERWGRQLTQDMIERSLKDQRRSSVLRWIVRGVLLVYLGVVLILMSTCNGMGTHPDVLSKNSTHVAVIEIRGEISEGGPVDAEWVIPSLREAFKNKNSRAIVLSINSPGGSPVQSSYIYDEIIRLRQQYPDKKVYAVITEQCASGGYYIAAAANEIYANRASLIGSIGVRMGGFSYVDVMKKLGIERRVITSADQKLFMDPYSPQTRDSRTHAQHLVDEIHQQFVDAVKRGRGSRLSDSPLLFSGLIWTGPESIELGLIDGLGDIYYVTETVLGVPERVKYSPPRGWLDELMDQISLRIAMFGRAEVGM